MACHLDSSSNRPVIRLVCDRQRQSALYELVCTCVCMCASFCVCVCVCVSGCEKSYHKKCAYRIPNNCTRLKNADGVSNPPLLINPTEVWSGRPLWIDRTLKSRPQVPHTFFLHTVKKPVQCFHCKKTVRLGRPAGCSRGIDRAVIRS